MNKQKVGLILFWLAVVWAIFWGIFGSVMVTSELKDLTMEELNQTSWSVTGPWFITWGVFGVPMAAIIAVIGMLLYSDAKGSTILKFGIGTFIALIISMSAGLLGHIPILFGIGGALILMFFFGITWLWAKERKSQKDASSAPANLRMIGYTFMLMAAWFTCGMAGMPFLRALEGQPPSTPLHLMILLVLGWFFHFLSYYKSGD